ncbi:phosphoenolpyruvate carboxylase [Kordiimonas sediminis]|nr:phosphoenolpyruvate carboxylase [Kordiimonas sediminis]
MSTDLINEIQESIAAYRASANEDPVINPYSPLAFKLARAIDEGTFTLDAVKASLSDLNEKAFKARVRRLRAYIGQTSPADNQQQLTAAIDNIADKADTFDQFQDHIEQDLIGLVITAHPTFAYDENTYANLVAATFDQPHKAHLSPPDSSLDLNSEYKQAAHALETFHKAFDKLAATILQAAQKHYPEDWKLLTPRLITIASWVGFDLDGRSDITWLTSVRFRLKMAAGQLRSYADRWAELSKRIEDTADSKTIGASLQAYTEYYSRAYDHIPSEPDDIDAVRTFSKNIATKLPDTTLSFSGLKSRLGALATHTKDSALATDILVFRARLSAFGFGQSHMHFRLNASQLHNGIRPLVSMEKSPDIASSKRRFITAVSSLLDTVEAQTVSFEHVATERVTAARLFMLVSQFRRYFNDDTPIRFLIAEADTPFTVLAALYYAKLFGVDDITDISPLFETEIALERGSKVIEELLENPHYYAYVKKRGRLAVQAGYSDAGRYMGQVAAGLSIERLRMKLMRLWQKFDLEGVELLIFDTGGESVGRGAHPESLQARLRYYNSYAARGLCRDLGISYKQEISLQGGDGYMLLGNTEAALATVSQILTSELTIPPRDAADYLYEDTDWSLDFFLKLKEFHSRLTDDPDYLTLIASMGPEILYPSGSRMTIRQVEGRAPAALEKLSQIRAIPHNALLQQMGFFSNSVSGLGGAINSDPDSFEAAIEKSERLRHILKLVNTALDLTDEDLLRGYIAQFDPQYWIDCLRFEKEEHRHRRIKRLVKLLVSHNIHEPLRRMNRVFDEDLIDLKDQLETMSLDKGFTLSDEEKNEYILLHVIRIALIQRLFILTTRIPRFASHKGTTTETIKLQILKFQIPSALSQLREIFQAGPDTRDAGPNYEGASYTPPNTSGYAWEHVEVFDAIEDHFNLIRDVSMTLSGYTGAMG